MRLFLYPLLLSIAILMVFAKISTPILAPQSTSSLPIHRTLYLERGIFEDQIYHVVEAAMEWNEVTNGDVVLDVKMLPQPDLTPSDAIIVMNVTPDYPESILLDNMNHYSTLAFYNNEVGLSYIAFIYERITDNDYNTVIMHEIGHALGLEHIKGIDGIGTLMYPNIELGSDHITMDDLKQFCQLYHCDASKYHVIPQIQ
jgi:Matrixin